MKSNSRAKITAIVSKHGPISRVQLAKLTDLSRSHLCEIVDNLIAEGILVESGLVTGARGRPRVLLSVNSSDSIVAGVWFSETDIRVSVAAMDGAILVRSVVDYESCSENPEEAVRLIADEIRGCVIGSGRDTSSLKGVGVTACGFINPFLGLMAQVFRRPWLNDTPIGRLLGEALGVPVYVDTDIRASALADQWERGETGNTLYVSFCAGVGSAFVTGQRLFGAGHACFPVVGHLILDMDGPPCTCGKRGCLEVYASTGSFIRRIWPEIDVDRLGADEAAELLERGMTMAAASEPRALDALVDVTKYIGVGLSNAVRMLDPQTIYLGGTLLECAPDLVADMIRREMMRFPDTNRFGGVEIKVLPILREFEMRGALSLVLLRPYQRLQEINSEMFSLRSTSEPKRELARITHEERE